MPCEEEVRWICFWNFPAYSLQTIYFNDILCKASSVQFIMSISFHSFTPSNFHDFRCVCVCVLFFTGEHHQKQFLYFLYHTCLSLFKRFSGLGIVFMSFQYFSWIDFNETLVFYYERHTNTILLPINKGPYAMGWG